MRKDNKIMREWNDAARSFSDFVRERKDYFREKLNNPATFKIIGDVRGKKVLDLGCGEGYNARILAGKGATVVGVDFSPKLIKLAKEKEMKENLGTTYYISDAADMKDVQSNHFDLVVCFMALQDIENYEKALTEVARVLKEGGRFIFSIPHPCFERVVKGGKCFIDWRLEKAKNRAGKESYLEIRRYFGIGEYEVRWDMKRISKPFRTTSFHRTLTDYFQALHANTLLVSRLVEPRPTSKAVSEYPSLRKRLKIPQSIVIEARKMKT
jgi:2-polyprenyl-3-methyl-5-hydroxy-6-metoxy-1,4-benzoquinol methylase